MKCWRNFSDSGNSSKTQVNSEGALLEGAFWALPIRVFKRVPSSNSTKFFWRSSSTASGYQNRHSAGGIHHVMRSFLAQKTPWQQTQKSQKASHHINLIKWRLVAAHKRRHRRHTSVVSFPPNPPGRRARKSENPNVQKTHKGCGGLRGRKFRRVPEGGANLPAAIFLAGKCPYLRRDSTSCCRNIGEIFPAAIMKMHVREFLYDMLLSPRKIRTMPPLLSFETFCSVW